MDCVENLDITFRELYFSKKSKFNSWLKAKKVTDDYIRDIGSSLDKVMDMEFKNPVELRDQIRLSKGAKYRSLATRNWVNFLEDYELLEEATILKLQKKIKIENKSNVDAFVPDKHQVQRFYDQINEHDTSWGLFIEIALMSGLRLTEVEYFINNYKKADFEFHGDIVIYPLYLLKGNKHAYYLFMKRTTYDKLIKLNRKKDIKISGLKKHIYRHMSLSLKYLRKFTMTQLIRSGVIMEFANFFEGRGLGKNVGFQVYLEKKLLGVEEYKKLDLEINFN